MFTVAPNGRTKLVILFFIPAPFSARSIVTASVPLELAVENPVNHYDYHATLLHLLGLDSGRLSYPRNGQEDSLLSGQPGKVVTEILA